MSEDRIVGQKQIVSVFSKMYGITSWPGALKNIKKNNLPLRRTPSGRPMFYRHELIAFDEKFQDAMIGV